MNHNSALLEEYPQVLIGMALATFEKLPHRQQDLVKNVAMCSQESDSDAHLVSQGVFRAVMPLPTKMLGFASETQIEPFLPPQGMQVDEEPQRRRSRKKEPENVEEPPVEELVRATLIWRGRAHAAHAQKPRGWGGSRRLRTV
eukprot:g2239.t1